MTVRRITYAMVCCALAVGCVKLDGFFFQADSADSIEEDYHGLPLFQGDGAPPWVDEDAVEREIYLSLETGEILSSNELDDAGPYVHGAFLPAPTDCPPSECPLVDTGVTFLYQHGNSGNLFRYWYRAVALQALGAGVFVYTYRGYGLSSGEASRGKVLEDAEAAMGYLLGRDDVLSERIVAYGYSTGAIPVGYLVGRSSHRDQFAGAILESGLDAIESIMDLSLRTEFPGGFFFDDTPFDGPTFIADARPELPILHIHGALDTRVPVVQTERYFEILRDRPGYTDLIGQSNRPEEDWLARAGHRNVVNYSFAAENHIADYWDHPENPGHCCVHPLEYERAENAEFLQQVGQTDGATSVAAGEQYAELIAGWVQGIL